MQALSRARSRLACGVAAHGMEASMTMHAAQPAATMRAYAARPAQPARSFTHAVSLSAPSAAAAAASASSSSSSSSSAPFVPRGPRHRRLPAWAEAPCPRLLSLNDLQPRPMKVKRRYGRGRGSGIGKTCGRGIKGQGQRIGLRKRGFEGGSTPFWRRMPKIANSTAARYYQMYTPLTVPRLLHYISLGRIDGSQLITMKTLLDSGCLPRIPHGVKLLSGGLRTLDKPLHVQVSDCSSESRSLLESHGGSLHLVWFNRVTLRAHLHPLQFLRKHGRLPKHTGVPPPKKASKYGFRVEHVDY